MYLNVFCRNIENTLVPGRPGNLVVYHGISDSFVNQLSVLYEHLSDQEKSRAERFKRDSDYNCYVSVHALLRNELSKLLGKRAKAINIVETEYGKPYITDIDLPFSLSRTRNLFAFAIGRSNQLVGIDIEQMKAEIDYISISRNYFSIKEQQLILAHSSSIGQKRTFFEIWTRKEALLKAVGVGLITKLSKVEVLEGENLINLLGVHISNRSFKVSTTINKEALISIATSADSVPEFKNLSFILS